MPQKTIVISDNPAINISVEDLAAYKADPVKLVKAVREALNLTPAEAGQLLFGYSTKHAYDQWSMWENGTKKPSKPTIKFFELILILALAKKQDVHGANEALDIFLSMQESK